MDCRELDNLLYPYLDGELVEGDRIAVETHLSACEGCRGSTDRERAMLLVIRTRAKSAAVEAPASLRSRLQEKLSEHHRARRVRQVSKLAAAAAGIAVCSVAAHQGWRSYQRGLYVQDAVSRHARAYPLEIEKPTPEQLEAWFDGKLDHHVAVPRYQNVVTRGGRLLNVRDRQAAYIRFDTEKNRRLGLFVYGDKPGDVDVSEPEVDRANGFNTVTWREGDVVYTLVTDLDDDDIRAMLPPRAGNPALMAPPTPQFQPVGFEPFAH
jgi:anti-sigma factor (TIGR02949 family)